MDEMSQKKESIIVIKKSTLKIAVLILVAFVVGMLFDKGITGFFIAPTNQENQTQPTQQPTQPTQQPSQEPEINWALFETVPNEIKNKVLSFNYQAPVQIENNVQEFKDYEICKNTVIVFYAETCGWCKQYHPILVEAKKDFDNFKFYRVVLSQERGIAEKYRITGTPATVINCKYVVVGYMPKETLYPLIEKYA